ncbi:glycosyl hydrolase family 28-related protein [Mycolicibacterium neoaurum]|uniref:glycosyl hydrolase family 28-related protein n=1 Tax=Mycolicibacterium neoaurum TaxID=1795 RepID=UPI001F4C5D69|nr:glycosyl hydrolase family 28-related protein [Mycolicibacterium neoaurum]
MSEKVTVNQSPMTRVVVDETADITVVTVVSAGPQGPGGDANVSDASATGKGVVQLTGDLAGTATAPTVPALANKVDKVVGKGLSSEDYTAGEKTKLGSIAAGATQNASDAALRDRTTHTGTQPISTVSGLQTALDSKADKSSLPVNVRDYGATGNGSTNDTAAIQDAIDSAGVGGSILIPSGTYIVDPDVSLHLQSSQTLAGVGRGSVLKIKDNADVLNNLLKVESKYRVVIRDLTIDGNRDNQDESDLVSVNYGVYVAGSDFCLVENVYVHHTTGVGIHVYDSIGTVVSNGESAFNRYHGFECEQCTSTVWTGIRGHDNDRHGMFNSPGEVGGTGSIGNTVTAFSFDNNGQYGYASGIDAAGLSIGLSRDNILSNGALLRNGHYGGSLYRTDYTTISGVLIAENGYTGLHVYRSQGNQIIGNRFHNNSQAADGAYDEILIEGANDGQASRNNIISDNIFVIDGAAKSRWAINEATANDGPNFYSNNVATLAGTAGKFNIQHTASTQVVDTKADQTIGGKKIFSTGFGVGANSVTPSAALAGVDAPFGTSSPGRVFSKYGMQLVTSDGAFDVYVSEGGTQNNVATFHHDRLDMRSYTIANAVLSSPRIAGGSVPQASSAPGVQGQVQWDAGYIYVCVATNTWKRATLAAW